MRSTNTPWCVREYLGQVAKEWEEQRVSDEENVPYWTNLYLYRSDEGTEFEQFSEQDLTAHPSSYQQMTDQVFLLLGGRSHPVPG